MANVRIFAYRGMRQIQQVLVKQFNADSVFVLEEPYLWSQVLASNGATPVSSTPVSGAADGGSTILRIECPDGFQIRYEINPSGPSASNARLAGNSSPRLAGFDNFQWGAGYSISIVDAASFL